MKWNEIIRNVRKKCTHVLATSLPLLHWSTFISIVVVSLKHLRFMSDFSSKLFLLFCFDWWLEWFKQNNFIPCDVVKKEIWYHPVALVFQQLRYFVLAHKDQISNELSLNRDLGQGYNKSKKMAFHFSAGRSCEKPISAFQKKQILF